MLENGGRNERKEGDPSNGRGESSPCPCDHIDCSDGEITTKRSTSTILITCTNTLHYFPNPAATLHGLRRLLVPSGQMLIEDYTLRGFPFPWKAFKWAIKLYDPQHVRLYTCSDAQALCRQALLQVIHMQTFPINLFSQGWVLLLQPNSGHEP